MRSVLAIAAVDLRRRLRSRTFLIVGIATPLIFATIIGLAFGGGFSFRAKIGVVDDDGSDISRQIVSGLVGSNGGDSPVTFAALDSTDGGDAQHAVASGAYDAVIEIPTGFGASVEGASPQPLGVVVDVSKRITADVTTSIARRVSDQVETSRLAVSAATRLPGSQATTDVQQLTTQAQDVQLALDVQPVDIGGAYDPVAYYAPSMGMLFLFFTIGAGARSIITEREEGTLQRVRAAPLRDTQILVGKTAAVLVLGLASMLVLWVVTSSVFHAAWGDPWAVAVVVVGIVFAVSGISMLLTGFARTEEQAQGYTSLVAFTLALIGGNFLSPNSLPPLLQRLSLLTPNGWALRALTDIGASGAGVRDVLPAVVVMIAIGLFAGLVGLRTLRGKLEG